MICNWEGSYNGSHDFTVSLFPTYLPAWFASLLLHWTPAWTMNIIFFLPGGRRWPYSEVLFCQIGSGAQGQFGKFRNCKIAAILTILILLSPPTLLSVLKIINGLFQFGLNARVPEKLNYEILPTFFSHQPVRCFWSWGRDKQGEGICFGVFASVWWVRVGGGEDRGENLKFSQLSLRLKIVFFEGKVKRLKM